KNKILAEGNRIKKIVNPAPRGMIYDRNEKELVRNVPIYRIKNAECRIENGECWQTISREEALRMEARGETENLRMDIGRDYLYGRSLAHVLGYLSEANPQEVEEGRWEMGDLVGRTGVEEKYDALLRGKDGGELIEVDSLGNKVREIGKIEPVPGKDIHLSIDGELSKVAWEALGDRPGAVVANEVKTGQVLVLVSSPSFNPNQISEQDLTNPGLPFFNRAIGGAYPPGSTFKIVTATAGVEEGKVNENTTFEDPGEIRVGEYVYRNWYFTQYGKTEGTINLVRAIKRSTDTFFYKVGEWVGATTLAEWARVFDLGLKEGIDIPGEVAGLVPDPGWKEKTTGERWFLGDTYHFAIGQADLLATPLQINMMTSIIANDGLLCRPRIFQSPVTPRTEPRGEASHQSPACQDLKLKPETLRLIKEGMKEACSPGGTAFPLFDFKPQVGCKTGTAEFGDPAGRTHAWLTAFAPSPDGSGQVPEIVVTALVEGGGEGSYIAAPIVKKVMESYFHGR
ncbi:MAG: peptidoglycan glycosyltransferase, partial [Microgenomates group bacterium LiPW_31]